MARLLYAILVLTIAYQGIQGVISINNQAEARRNELANIYR